jgi:hypothetical protein
MASKIKAIGAYRPRVKLGKTAQMKEVVAYIADRTGLNEGEISIALKELRDAVAFFNLSGRAVKLEGLGTYAPKVGLDGTFDVAHRTDAALKNRLNTPRAFLGDIVNRDMIGKTADDLVARWNQEHPDDPVT